MTMNPLPPQAYTKDTLLKAYQWLMNQNSSIKEMATTPDILVSLFLKANRDGESALERPSIKNFKSELKSLAGMMGELDRPAIMGTPPAMAATATVMEPTSAEPVMASSASINKTTSSATANQTQVSQVSYTEKTVTATSRPMDFMSLFDSATRAMIHEVKEELNLSSDLEALRMLVKVGHSRCKGLLS